MKTEQAPVELQRRINDLFVARHAASRSELMALGLSAAALKERVATGRLIALHRGVYAPGGSPPTAERRWAAAVAACGSDAALSHLSAAALWRFRDRDPTEVHVSLAGRGRRTRPGINTHRPRRLSPSEVTEHRGIRATTPTRTIIDCASELPPRPLERMIDEAHHRRLLDEASLRRTLEAHPNRRGSHNLRRLLTSHAPGITRTVSPLEEAFLARVRAASLPEPLVNKRLGPWTIDFLWPDHRVCVETDGARDHSRRSRRESDRRRDAWLDANGYIPLRFTWWQVEQRHDEVLGELRLALRLGSGRSP